MEQKIRSRALGMYWIAAIFFLGLTYAYAQLEWRTPTTVNQSVVAARGSILAADGTELATSVEGKRVYPQGTLAGQVVGFMGTDAGLEGIEGAYNARLEHGENITLTIDPQIQALAEEALARRIPDSGGDAGSLVVLESKTGRILAAASYPPFNPANWEQYSPETWRNRPLLDVYEPGSPVKALTVAAALNEGVLTPDTEFETPMRRHVGGRYGHLIGDVVDHPATLTTTGILRYSSNVGISHIVERLPGLTLRNYLLAYGFGEKVDLGPVPTEKGLLHSENDFGELVRATSGFGQGVSGTTLQLAAAYNTLANGGLYIPPRLVEGEGAGERRDVLANAQARQIRPMLQTALEGIQHAAGVNGYGCAGKTGTAQIPAPEGGYRNDAFNSTYAGFCQTEDPRMTIAVMVHGATENYHGSQLAAPIFQEVASGIISLWSLPPEELPEDLQQELATAEQIQQEIAAQEEAGQIDPSGAGVQD